MVVFAKERRKIMSQYKQEFEPGYYLLILPEKEIEINVKEIYSITSSGALKIIDQEGKNYLISKSNFLALIPSMKEFA